MRAQGPRVLLFAIAVGAVAASDEGLRVVLARAGAYVERYQAAFSLLVGEEHYTQRVVRRGRETERRRLRSEFALVRVGGDPSGPRWLAFRDVLEVDDRPVADRGDRLVRLFRDAPADALARARAIALESARYNLGPVVRTINVPTLALEFFEVPRQPRLRYRRAGERVHGGRRVWVVRFEERARPTLIRSPDGRDVVARGEAWVDPESGRIVRTELTPEGRGGLASRITVTYASDARVGVWVPVEMAERYERGDALVTGEAVYTNFRRFEVDVRVKPITGPPSGAAGAGSRGPAGPAGRRETRGGR